MEPENKEIKSTEKVAEKAKIIRIIIICVAVLLICVSALLICKEIFKW